MKSSILIARIMRVIETDGQIGDGAGLADAYADAVKSVNARMEAVHDAESTKQVSDAVRLMEDSPRLLDEINVLDFNRLPDWVELCDRCGWQKPVPFDRTLLEKILMFGESKDVAEPFLRMYRKAVRTNNNALATKALRRLAEVDHSQNWEPNLAQAESALQRELGEAFSAAQASGDGDEQDRIAREVLETSWRNKPSGRVYSSIREYWEAKEAQRRETEGQENLTLLRRCRDENWNRGLAFAMIQAIDALSENGWRLPGDEQALVDECRKRVADEMEAEEKENSWKACCETLHGAIQREDTAAIREALAAPDFLDREPSEELLRDAQRVIEHEEAEKRRKMTKIAVSSLLALIAILGVSGWWLKQKLFSIRCEGEAAKLSELAKGAHAIDRMGEALCKLQADDPEVYDDPRVNVYIGKLKTMATENLARTNELSGILASLTACRNEQWTNATSSVTGQLARAEALLTSDDAGFRTRWLKLKASYAEYLAKEDDARREKAETRYKTLTARMKDLANRLMETVGGKEQDDALDVCKADLAEWRGDYGALVPEFDSKLTEAEKELADAEQKQKNVREALDKLKDAKTAPEILEARQTLIKFYSAYPFVGKLAPNPIETTAAREVLEGTSAGQKTLASFGTAGIAPDKFKVFLDESVSSFVEIPSYYSLYGLMVSGDRMEKFFAVSKGKPDFKRPSYADSLQISGELLEFEARRVTDKIEKKVRDVKGYTIESTDEIRSCVDVAARPNLTLGQFENEVLKLIDRHLQEAVKKDYLESERRFGQWDTLTRGRYTAYRRIQMLDLYFRWLKEELKTMPPDDSLVSWTGKAETLAQPVHVDGVPDDLSWVCLWERRVRDRNAECVRLLEKIPSDWVKRYREWRSARAVMREIAEWKIESAGQLLLDPRNSYQKKDPDAIIPIVLPSVAVDHPLYVVRQKPDGQLAMHKALVPQNGKWARTSGVKLIPGEPLYHVRRDGKPVDAVVEIQKAVKEIPERIVRSFAPKIPFFELEMKK